MRLLVIGLDPAVLDPSSDSAARQRMYYAGYEADIVVVAPGPRTEVLLGEGIRVFRGGGRNQAEVFFRSWKLIRTLAKQRYDVVTVQEPIRCGMLALLTRPARTFHLQDHSAQFARRPSGILGRILSPLAKAVARHADRIRTVSRRGSSGMISIGIPLSRIDTIPVPTDVSRFVSITRSASDYPRLLCIARLSQEKGVDVLLNAFQKIYATHPTATLTIVGDGPERASLEKLSVALSVEKSVYFVGAQTDVARYFSDADVYIQPSRYEGWGIAVVEAAASGVPIVMTDVGLAGEVIRDGVSGRIVPVEDPTAIADAVNEVLKDPSRADALARTARVVVQALPTVDESVRRVRMSLEQTERVEKMRLLVITQRVDSRDTNLAIHVRWLQELSILCETVTVIAQSVGSHELPSNVRVLSLGKEAGASKLRQYFRLQGFLWKETSKCDSILVLMVPLYVLLSAKIAMLRRKPIYLWYTHKHVSLTLRAATPFIRRVFSASPESFRLKTKKVRFLGHAIDTDFFTTDADVKRQEGKIVTVGRISPVKRLEILIDAVKELREKGTRASLDIVGAPILEQDRAYAMQLREQIDRLGLGEFVRFRGGLSPAEVRTEYQTASVCANASATGSLDKAILEAMACGCPSVTSNEAFVGIVPEQAFVRQANGSTFACAIEAAVVASSDPAGIRSRIVRDHNLHTTLTALVEEMKKGRREGML